MRTLEQFGIQPGGDEAHRISGLSVESQSADEFFKQAREILDGLSTEVMHDVIPHLENYSGKWHPTGFMVFPLGINADLGSLRLHIWPRELRRVVPQGNTIHDHAWHLASRILAGTYQDEIYTLEKQGLRSEDERKRQELLRVFTVGYKPGGADSLVTDGMCVRAVVREQRKAETGEHHTIEKGVFHKTTIPEDMLVATLVLDSPTVGNPNPHVLINGTADPISIDREAITREDLLTTKSQF